MVRWLKVFFFFLVLPLLFWYFFSFLLFILMFNLESHVWTAARDYITNQRVHMVRIMALSAYVAEDSLVIPQWEERLYVCSFLFFILMFNLESHVWTADIPCRSITANNIFLNSMYKGWWIPTGGHCPLRERDTR